MPSIPPLKAPSGRPRGRPPGRGISRSLPLVIPRRTVLESVGVVLKPKPDEPEPVFDADGQYLGIEGYTFSQKQEDILLDALQHGNTLVNACGLAELSPGRVKKWLSTGMAAIEDGISGEPEIDWLVAFAKKLMLAMATAEDSAVRAIHGSNKWEANMAWLERARKDSWKKQDSLDVNAKVLTGVVGLPLETLDAAAWQKAFAPQGTPAIEAEATKEDDGA